jgi:hypothetical protein
MKLANIAFKYSLSISQETLHPYYHDWLVTTVKKGGKTVPVTGREGP